MQKKAQKPIKRPVYLLESVDNALKLLQLLRDAGALRIKEAAREMDIAPSTAHRLLAMLVYRGFAVQDEKRIYRPGPAMGAGPAEYGWTRKFNDACRPHMEALAITCSETVNLVIRVGTQVRFLSTVESSAILRVGDRQGHVLPAEVTAGGRALLAELPPKTLERLYLSRGGQSVHDGEAAAALGFSSERFSTFRHELALVREAGFALNVGESEEGVAAVGVAVRNRIGQALGAITVTLPTSRFHRHYRHDLVPQIKRTVRDVEAEVAEIEP